MEEQVHEKIRKSLKKKKVDIKTYYKAIIKTKSNWIKDVNVEEEKIKLIGENIEKIYDLQVGEDFLNKM